MSLIAIVLSIAASFFSTDSVELVFAGDAMQHERQIVAAKSSGGSYDYSGYYDEVRPYIESADFAVVNLETPLGGKPYSGYPMFCAPDSYAEELKDAGFDFILTANNHTLDRRDKGLKRTLDALDRLGLPHTGTFRNRTERDSLCPAIVDVNGFKIGMLNYTYGTNGIKIQNDVVVNYIDRSQIRKDIAKAKEKGAEIIAVCMHWGIEYVLLPNAEQKRLARFLEDEGVDLIIGSHPHVIQPMEMNYNDEYGKKVLTVYSLGNFVSAMRKDDTVGGAMVRVRIKRDGSGKAIVDTATYRLVVVQPPSSSQKNFKVLPAEANFRKDFQPKKNQFVRRATEIFRKHNKNVPADSMSISSYKP